MKPTPTLGKHTILDTTSSGTSARITIRSAGTKRVVQVHDADKFRATMGFGTAGEAVEYFNEIGNGFEAVLELPTEG